MMAWMENVPLCRSELELDTLQTFLTMIHYFFVWFGELREESVTFVPLIICILYVQTFEQQIWPLTGL